jgi:hypothetical protein
MYRAIKGEFGNVLNDHAMSIVVAKGYRARFCAEEGFMLRGSGDCEVHEAGRHDLRFATSISFIQVFDLSDTSPEDDKLPVTPLRGTGAGRKDARIRCRDVFRCSRRIQETSRRSGVVDHR